MFYLQNNTKKGKSLTSLVIVIVFPHTCIINNHRDNSHSADEYVQQLVFMYLNVRRV